MDDKLEGQGRAETIFGWIGLLVIIAGVIGIVGWVSRGLNESAKENAVRTDYKERMIQVVRTLEIDATKLSTDGRLPADPHILIVVRQRKPDAGGRPTMDELDMTVYPRFSDVYLMREHSLPDESHLVIAQKPEEVDTVVLVHKENQEAGRYDTGALAFSHKWTVAVINVRDKSLVAKESFLGGPPPPTKKGIGPAWGSEPEHAAIWVTGLFSAP